MHIRIQLVSEANLIRSALICLLKGEEDFIVLNPVECAPPCHRLCCASESDVIIIDTISGRNNGLHCLKQITTRHPEKSILLLIAREHFSLTNELLKNGAKGVISIEITPETFIQSIRDVATGKTTIGPHLLDFLENSSYQHATNPFDTLTSRERDVLELILSGIHTEECATRLHISKKTVANHYTHIRKKLGIDNLIQLTRLAIRHNIIKP